MFEKLKNFYAIFRAGQSVVDAWKVKNYQLLGSYLGAFLGLIVALGKIYGYDFHVSDEDLVAIGGGLAAVASLLHGAATVASTDKIGVLPFKRPDSECEQRVSILAEDEPSESVRSEPKSAVKAKSIWSAPDDAS